MECTGGGAAHVLQQLAYLGVGGITPADADRVDITSLNRLIGALPPRRRTLNLIPVHVRSSAFAG